MLRRHLEDIFAEEGSCGLLEPEEVKTMAAVVFQQMDKNESGEIGCSEFIQACTDDGEISLKMMARFFDTDQKISRTARLLDSTLSQKRRSEQQNFSMMGWRFSEASSKRTRSSVTSSEASKKR